MFKDLKLILRDGGFISTNIPAYAHGVLETALRWFLELPSLERQQYSQKEFAVGFDGYSYLGQKDSLNQYDKDLLHSFGLSNISKEEYFPQAFQKYLQQEFLEQVSFIRKLKKEVLKTLGFPEYVVFYEKHIRHMISCNFYPELDVPTQKIVPGDRLSFHTDVSLFSVFLFGLESGFACEMLTGEKIVLDALDEVVLFSVYFMELLTNGKIKALNHGVALPENRMQERFSFTFFSIPQLDATLQLSSFKGTGSDYYQHYLKQF
ncbi:MAG: isopenicillin N synthase-like dioxygenase [Maribacter sp.]|jgi:isopenicillin N synthase-like dioxygenase